VICQICGRSEILDTDKPLPPEPRWTTFRLGEVIPRSIKASSTSAISLAELYENYEIWLCPSCMAESIEGWEADWDPLTGELAWDPLYKEDLEDRILDSLELSVDPRTSLEAEDTKEDVEEVYWDASLEEVCVVFPRRVRRYRWSSEIAATLAGTRLPETHNQAEYLALVIALYLLNREGFSTRVILYGDSELVVKQMNGEYAVRSPAIRPFYEKATEALSALKEKYRQDVEIEWISRERNLAGHILEAADLGSSIPC